MALLAFNRSMFMHTCVVKTTTEQPRGARGSANPSVTATSASLPCYAELTHADESSVGVAGRPYVQSLTTAKFWFPADPHVAKGDYLVYAGRNFNATGPSFDDSGTGKLFTVRAVEAI